MKLVMCTMEEFKAEIENNPLLKQLLEEQLKYFFPLWLQEKMKERTIHNMPEEDKNFLFQAIILQSISDSDVKKYAETEKFSEIKKMYADYLNGNINIFNSIQELFSNNVKKVYENAEKIFNKYKKDHLNDKKRKQIEELEKKGKYDIIDKIYKEHYENDEKLKVCTDALNVLLKIFDVKCFDAVKLKNNQSLIDKLVVAILRPDLLIPEDFEIVLNNENPVPGDWYIQRKLSVADYRELLQDAESTDFWKELYKDIKENILQKAKLPLLPIRKRESIIYSVFENIEKENCDVAMIILFPVIEGLLWELTSLINKTEKVFVKKDTFIDTNTATEFVTNRIREVVERTAVKKYLDPDFIQEFCNELYEERNPVLHGNTICSNDCENFTICFMKKIFALDYIIETFVEVQKNIVFKCLEESFTKDKIEELIESYKKVVPGV